MSARSLTGQRPSNSIVVRRRYIGSPSPRYRGPLTVAVGIVLATHDPAEQHFERRAQ